jgi:hypothetical protein
MYPIFLPRFTVEPSPDHQQFSLRNPDGFITEYEVPRPDAVGRAYMWVLEVLSVGIKEWRTVFRRRGRPGSNYNDPARPSINNLR